MVTLMNDYILFNKNLIQISIENIDHEIYIIVKSLFIYFQLLIYFELYLFLLMFTYYFDYIHSFNFLHEVIEFK